MSMDLVRVDPAFYSNWICEGIGLEIWSIGSLICRWQQTQHIPPQHGLEDLANVLTRRGTD